MAGEPKAVRIALEPCSSAEWRHRKVRGKARSKGSTNGAQIPHAASEPSARAPASSSGLHDPMGRRAKCTARRRASAVAARRRTSGGNCAQTARFSGITCTSSCPSGTTTHLLVSAFHRFTTAGWLLSSGTFRRPVSTTKEPGSGLDFPNWCNCAKAPSQCPSKMRGTCRAAAIHRVSFHSTTPPSLCARRNAGAPACLSTEASVQSFHCCATRRRWRTARGGRKSAMPVSVSAASEATAGAAPAAASRACAPTCVMAPPSRAPPTSG
mmetsp:Transcript_73932/g.204031  ORF Transcript_73932/g.204031 Transcript_73932/m.204031 type:complete len:268 (-) Transcript_73932:132-935(-)